MSTIPKIQVTKNLGTFKNIDVNRDYSNAPSRRRIGRIAASIKKNGFLPSRPIIVTSKFIIVDGQHRVEAARLAGSEVYFIVDTTIPNTAKGIFEAARSLNKDSKDWAKKDYMHGYSSMGNESYKTLEEFCNKYPMFTFTEQLMLLQNSGTKHANKAEFSEGKFNVKNLKTAEKWADNLLQLKPYFEKGYNKSVFVRTLLTIAEKKKEFDFKEFIHKVKLRPNKLVLCGDKRGYSAMIDEIYNYRRSVDEKVDLRIS